MLQLGQILHGRASSYMLTRQVHDTVWFAVSHPMRENVVIKYHVKHWGLSNERDMLRRFQGMTPHVRPLLDEVEMNNANKWPALVLRRLDDDVEQPFKKRQLKRREIKLVGHGVLKALQALHEEGFVHTDIKPKNVLINYGRGSAKNEIVDVQLADLECATHSASKWAQDGYRTGISCYRSPENFLQMGWDTSMDVWSFGAMMIDLIHGRGFRCFKPSVPRGHKEFETSILLKQCQYFGPYPWSIEDIANADQMEMIQWLINNTHDWKCFRDITTRELLEEDKDFLEKIMKLDPRDRPTVTELLADPWFASADIPGHSSAERVCRGDSDPATIEAGTERIGQKIEAVSQFQRHLVSELV